ncbi:MAG: chloride channel protein [Pseudomonadota bacterium]
MRKQTQWIDSTTEGLPVIPSLAPLLDAAHVSGHATGMDRRMLFICTLTFGISIIAAVIARGLISLIGFITHLFFYGELNWLPASPANNHLGLWVVGVPVVGALIVGLMARYGSQAIRGHGIPEAMEQILTNRSRIPARILFLKPLSAAISIGTGGPFGAEGPIIATGGALGSVVGQWVRVTADERKTLLAAGAAAGMAATFGTPLAAVLLAIELLLFEFRTRSLLPVVIACGTAAIVRALFTGFAPFFSMPALAWPTVPTLVACILLGAIVGVVSVGVTRGVYAVEDAFEHLPLHWMWWPALGAVVVGVIGYIAPRSLGVGYDNISDALSGNMVGPALWMLGAAKLVSWMVSLGSGTSGGTLAPLMTVGACLGAALGHIFIAAMPGLALDPRLAALVGMAAIFAGAARALFMSIVFALEATWQMAGLLPLLIGCSAAYLVSSMLMKQTIMTEKIARRGVNVPVDYSADAFMQMRVVDHMHRSVVTLLSTDTLEKIQAWLAEGTSDTLHQGYPVVNEEKKLVGVLTRKDLYRDTQLPHSTLSQLVQREPLTICATASLAVAIELMSAWDVGRLPVIDESGKLVGMLTRSDLLKAYRHRLLEQYHKGH